MERPNIIVIYTDQQRFDTLGVNGLQAHMSASPEKRLLINQSIPGHFLACTAAIPANGCPIPRSTQ